jgi:ABC-type glycerol-3-phosphate transport system substrate-binding protein
MKRYLVVLLALLLLACSFAGCKQEEEQKANPEETTKNVESDEETKTVEEKTTIQVVCPSNVQDFPEGITPNDNFIVEYWEEQTGYDFDIVVMAAESDEKFNVMFSSGEISGLAFNRDVSAVSTLASQGLVANFDDYIDESVFFQKFVRKQLVCMKENNMRQ